ncbi:MAG: WD40 repeat domain-containing protein [Mycobacterium sp.]
MFNENFTPRAWLKGHGQQVTSVAFSPDGRRAVSSSWDHTLRLWPTEAAPKTLCDKLATNVSQKTGVSRSVVSCVRM